MPTLRQKKRQQLGVSYYDRVSSWLVALLIMSCVTVSALVMIYFTNKFILTEFAVPVTPVASGGGGTGGVAGAPGDNQDAPGIEDAPASIDPQIQETLSAVASAVVSKSALLADEQVDVGAEVSQGSGDNRTPGFGGGRGGGVGGGIGSGFGPGRGGPGEPRREVRFEPASLLEYAQWLDYFHIELGVLGQDNKVYYAYNLSRERPDVKTGDPAKEQRLFMNPTDSQFAALDRQLAKKAGIADKGRIILQFYPPEASGILFGLEQNHAKASAREPQSIRSTSFRVKRTGNDFQFSVEEQTYR